MKRIASYIKSVLAIAAIAMPAQMMDAGTWLPNTTGQWLVTEPYQLTSNVVTTTYYNEHIPAGDLVNNSNTDHYFSVDEGASNPGNGFYLQIELKEPLYLQPDEDLVIYTRRWKGKDKHPTTFHVQASTDGVNWSGTVVYAFLLYRGPLTHEFSSRIHTDGLENKGYKYLRLSVTANNTKSLVPGTEVRYMNVGDLNIMKIKRDANYTDTHIDRLHLVSDYFYKYQDHDFVHTMGIIDPANRNISPAIETWTDWSGWANGKWTKDGAALSENAIKMPDYSWLTAANDPDRPQGQRQPTHTVEHDLYAIPGDIIALYPFYAMNDSYHEHFIHWYDYKTGGITTDSQGTALLDFLFDPSGINKTRHNGYFGGYAMTVWGNENDKKTLAHANSWYGRYATFFQPRDIHKPDGQQYHLEEEEYVIAADFAQYDCFRPEIHIPKESTTILEPPIAFRHIFRIRDGKKFADDNMSTVEKNRTYIKKNMRYVSARAGHDFQVRFDSPIPNNSATPSKWYYKISETDYRRIRTMEIRVYNADNGQEISRDNTMFYPAESFDGEGSRPIDGINYSICGGGGSYYRMLKCDAAKAREGRYIVRLVARDINDNIIKIPDGSGEDLYVQEMHVTFLPEDGASVLNEAELKAKPTHTTEYLERPDVYGAPKAKIDFDEYRVLENPGVVQRPEDYIYIADQNLGHRYYRWPVPFDQSTYGFGYDLRHDYNMYQITNHSSCVAYHGQADSKPATENFGHGTGLYDRHFYDSEGLSRGYFYYVNAAADPGVMARLNVDEICLGSSITVSAWASEFSGGETCNIAFNFVAVMKEGGIYSEGERVPLHTFITGYLPSETMGRWMHIYYSFVPDITSLDVNVDQIDHYELELDNNCKNSGGADYAIDDIRVYVSKPQIYATQTTLMCTNDTKATDVRIESPFDVLLQNFGETASTSAPGRNIDLFYTFLDKDIYDTVKKNEGVDEARRKATLAYGYNWNDGDNTHTYGRLSFSTHFESNPEYQPDQEPGQYAGRFEEPGTGNRLIVFNTRPRSAGMSVGKEYYIVLFMNESGNNVEPVFDLEDGCSKLASFRVQGAHIIKVDGFTHYEDSPIEICEGQSPVVQVDIYGKDDNGELHPVQNSAYLDWYYGRHTQYMDEKHTDGQSLDEILRKFREVYPDATTTDVEPADEMGLTADMLEYLGSLTVPTTETDANGNTVVHPARLVLHRSSYVFAPVHIPYGSDEATLYVTAIPSTYIIDNYLVCTEPSEVRITVRRQAPVMLNGFPEGIDYPAAMTDVPLRIGLQQIRKVSAAPANMENAANTLNVPIRSVSPVTENVSAMTLADDRSLYLVETNDPALRTLTAAEGGLPVCGMVRSLTALKGAGTNMVKIVLSDDIDFREGYYYRLRFNYDEDLSDATPDDDTESSCSGQTIFTIKVVPEYQKWTGAAGRNWNNDANWRRVTRNELLADATDTGKNGFVTDDGLNDNTSSYAPLDFTKVIIPRIDSDADTYDGEDYPFMFNDQPTYITYAGNTVATQKWSQAADDADAGYATTDIRYDMAPNMVTGTGIVTIECRPWYANTCEQIHFESGAQMHRQNWFGNYERAWVDIDVSPSRWYTMGMPLQGVMAGDMYLPTESGIQQSELFKDIKFDTALHNRFQPAVFQRSWNKAQATVYELPGSATAPSTNVAGATTWSNVYNDVEVPYSGGEGFSIKTDVSAISFSADKVRFRLPKADTRYEYYSQDGTQVGNPTDIARPDGKHHKLFPMDKELSVTVHSAAAGNYFLIGNPFITRIDMAEFLRVNSGVIEPAYWILSGEAQTASVWDDIQGAFFSNTDGDARSLAVAQGFFVKSLAAGTELTVKFTKDMFYEPLAGGDNALARSGNDTPAFIVTAITDGACTSRASVRVCQDASDDGYTSKHAELLFDPSLDVPSTVYTVAGNRAMTLNTVPTLDGTEIGLLADQDVSTTLIFTNTEHAYGLQLLDIQTGDLTDITEGMEYTLTGSASGRLFLTGNTTGTADSNLSIKLNGNVVTVASTEDNINARVSDTMGRILGTYSNGTQVVSFELSSGFHIVEAYDGSGHLTRKIFVK